MERRSKRKAILCIFLALVLLMTGILVVWQGDNLRAYALSKLLSRQTLSDRMHQVQDDNRQKLADQGVTVEAPPQEALDKLIRGEIPADSVSVALPETADGSAQTAVLNACAAELYRYQVALYAELGNVWQSARAEWKSHPKAERTAKLKNAIKMDAMSTCYGLEAEADKQVAALLEKYRAEMVSVGGDPSEIDALWSVYCSEKASVKAYYLNLAKFKEEKQQ